MAATLIFVTGMVATRDPQKKNTCTQADVDRPTPSIMPVPERVERPRKLNGYRMDPLPPDYLPRTSAEQARARYRARQQPGNGGGSDELLLGVFTGSTQSGPSWALLSHRLAQPLNSAPLPPDVKPLPLPTPCVFIEFLSVLHADTGEVFFGSTRVSKDS